MEKALPFKAINPDLRKYGPSLTGRILILEGLISAGKSTAGREIIDFVTGLGIKCKFFPEPLIPELLQLFLSNQKKYAFAFQLGMLVKRQAIYREAADYASKGYFCVIDRSIYGDYCFALMHKKRGNISDGSELLAGNNIANDVTGQKSTTSEPAEWKSYMEVLHSEQFEHPDYVIYLEVTPDTAIKRCVRRDRQGESKYDRAYFQELCDVYSSVIPSSPAKHFLVIDWNEDRTDGSIAKPLLNEVKKLYDSL